jgi:hypothetical protein
MSVIGRFEVIGDDIGNLREVASVTLVNLQLAALEQKVADDRKSPGPIIVSIFLEDYLDGQRNEHSSGQAENISRQGPLDGTDLNDAARRSSYSASGGLKEANQWVLIGVMLVFHGEPRKTNSEGGN